MQFPRRIGVLIAKVALERIMSPERADQLFVEVGNAVREIRSWMAGPKVVPPEESVTPQEAVQLASAQEGVDKPTPEESKNAVDLAVKLDLRFAKELEDAPALEAKEATEKAVRLVKSELPGRANAYVLWLDIPEVVRDGKGRFVHFSWDTAADGRIGYKIRDFIDGRMSHQSHTRPDADWTHNRIECTAEEIWKGARHHIPTAKATGLDLGSLKDNRPTWKAVLNALTLNTPANLLPGRGETSCL